MIQESRPILIIYMLYKLRDKVVVKLFNGTYKTTNSYYSACDMMYYIIILR